MWGMVANQCTFSDVDMPRNSWLHSVFCYPIIGCMSCWLINTFCSYLTSNEYRLKKYYEPKGSDRVLWKSRHKDECHFGALASHGAACGIGGFTPPWRLFAGNPADAAAWGWGPVRNAVLSENMRKDTLHGKSDVILLKNPQYDKFPC
jgi:hypothetical protein